MKIKLFALAFAFVLYNSCVFATRQMPDKLYINGHAYPILATPLWNYFEQKGERTIGGINVDDLILSTGLHRGILATWEFSSDRLYLIRLQDARGNRIELTSEFTLSPNTFFARFARRLVSNRFFARWFGSSRFYARWASPPKVFAEWFTGTIGRPIGDLVYPDWFLGADTFEDEEYLLFEKGKLVYSSTIKSLRNEIKAAVLEVISVDERDAFEEDRPAFLSVSFDRNGSIRHISWRGASRNGRLLQPIAQRALEDFPIQTELMHERYSPRWFQIKFTADELKNGVIVE